MPAERLMSSDSVMQVDSYTLPAREGIKLPHRLISLNENSSASNSIFPRANTPSAMQNQDDFNIGREKSEFGIQFDATVLERGEVGIEGRQMPNQTVSHLPSVTGGSALQPRVLGNIVVAHTDADGDLSLVMHPNRRELLRPGEQYALEDAVTCTSPVSPHAATCTSPVSPLASRGDVMSMLHGRHGPPRNGRGMQPYDTEGADAKDGAHNTIWEGARPMCRPRKLEIGSRSSESRNRKEPADLT